MAVWKFYHLHARNVEFVSEYILKKNKQKKTQKKPETRQKVKETKAEKRISVNGIQWHSLRLCCMFITYI